MVAILDKPAPGGGWLKRLFSEPTLHFVVLGALLFVVHRALGGDAHTIVVDRGVKADLARRFTDQTGRQPSAKELDTLLGDWKREEVLYREALANAIDREDPTIRTTLADKMRARAALELPKREPSPAELQAWLEKHRALYETPLEYDYELMMFPKSEPKAHEQFEKFASAVEGGSDARTLGRPIVGGNLSSEDLRERVGSELGERIRTLPIGAWQRVETQENLLLARLNRISGGLPPPDELQRRLLADWTYATRERALEEAVQKLMARYRFEDAP